MNLRTGIFRSSLAKKYIMALTGLALFGFVVGHMLGNLQIFLGANQINAYGHFLQHAPEILWPARIGLLLMVGLHIWAAVKLSVENRAARPKPYEQAKLVAASYASRTMLMSGLIVAVFIIYHLLHFTVQVQAINLTGRDFVTLLDQAGRHDVYKMMVIGFSNPVVSGFYVLGMALLCLHLSHGVSSLFQSLGLKNKTYGVWIDGFAKAAAVMIFLGNCAIPLAVLTGTVK